MEENPSYGKLSKVPAYRLRQIFNELLVQDYLRLSDDGYTIVKFGPRIGELLAQDSTIQMKTSKRTGKETKRKAIPETQSTGQRTHRRRPAAFPETP